MDKNLFVIVYLIKSISYLSPSINVIGVLSVWCRRVWCRDHSLPNSCDNSDILCHMCYCQPQGKVMFLHLFVCSQGRRRQTPPEADPLGQRPPWEEGTWNQTGSNIIHHHSWKEHGTRQEVTSYTPWYWHLVVGTHPTGMHSCLYLSSSNRTREVGKGTFWIQT